MMNEKAEELGMTDTHFEDCCGLTDSENHYTTARDVALMSRELTTKYPDIFQYSQIWMEDITHVTARVLLYLPKIVPFRVKIPELSSVN